MEFTVTVAMLGHQFACTFVGTSDEGKAQFYRDGAKICDGTWDVEGWVPDGITILTDIDDSEDVFRALKRAVREKVGPPSWIVADMAEREAAATNRQS